MVVDHSPNCLDLSWPRCQLYIISSPGSNSTPDCSSPHANLASGDPHHHRHHHLSSCSLLLYSAATTSAQGFLYLITPAIIATLLLLVPSEAAKDADETALISGPGIFILIFLKCQVWLLLFILVLLSFCFQVKKEQA